MFSDLVKEVIGEKQVKIATIIAIEKILADYNTNPLFSAGKIAKVIGRDFQEKWSEYTQKPYDEYMRTIEQTLEKMAGDCAVSKLENNIYTVTNTSSFDDYAVKNLEKVYNGDLSETNLLSDNDLNFANELCNRYFFAADNVESDSECEEDFDVEEETYEENFDVEEEIYEEDFDVEEETYEEDFDDEEEIYEEDFDVEEETYEEDFDDEEEIYEEYFDDEEETYEEDFDVEEETYEEDFDDEEDPFESFFNDEEDPFKDFFNDEEDPFGNEKTYEEVVQQDNSKTVPDDYEPDKEDKFAFEFIQKYIEHYFLGGNGKIAYSSVRSLIDFCEKTIDDADLCLENYEMENGDYVITDIEKIRQLLLFNSENKRG